MITAHVIVGMPGAGKTALAQAVERLLGGAECSEPLKYGGKLAGRAYASQRLVVLDEMPLWKAAALLTACHSREDWQGWAFLLEGDRYATPAFLGEIKRWGADLRVWEIYTPARDLAARNLSRGTTTSRTLLSHKEGRLKRVADEFTLSQLFNNNGTDINLLARRVIEMALHRHAPVFAPTSTESISQ